VLSGYIRLIRPINCLMGVMGAVIAIFVSGSGPAGNYILSAIVIILAMGGGNALNDYLDVDTDRIVHPDRPLPLGEIEGHRALAFSGALFFTSIMFSFLLSPKVFIVVAINVSLLVLYEIRLKRSGIPGNVVISYLVGSVFLFGGAVVGSMSRILPLFFLGFLSNFGREIAKGIEDLEGDKGKRRTLAIVNLPMARIVSFFSVIMAVMLSPIPHFYGGFSLFYIYIILMADAIFLYSLYLLIKNLKSSRAMRIAMMIALLAFVGGAL